MKLRMSRPGAEQQHQRRAQSLPATSAFLSRPRPPAMPRPSSLQAARPGPGAAPYNAGAIPNSNADRTATPRLTASAGPSSPNSTSPGKGVCRKELHECLDAGIREQAARRGACERQQQALDQQLSQKASPAGAECRTDGHLPLTGGGPGQHHVGHVAARNQHEQRDSGQGGEEDAAKVPDDRRDDVHHLHAKVLRILGRVRACAPRSRRH